MNTVDTASCPLDTCVETSAGVTTSNAPDRTVRRSERLRSRPRVRYDDQARLEGPPLGPPLVEGVSCETEDRYTDRLVHPEYRSLSFSPTRIDLAPNSEKVCRPNLKATRITRAGVTADPPTVSEQVRSPHPSKVAEMGSREPSYSHGPSTREKGVEASDLDHEAEERWRRKPQYVSSYERHSEQDWIRDEPDYDVRAWQTPVDDGDGEPDNDDEDGID